MPAVALDFHFAEYQTDQADIVRAWRTLGDVRFPVATGGELPCLCIVDSGAPLSVVPYSLWSGGRLSWTNWGAQLRTPSGRPLPQALTWQGAPCVLGAVEVDLVDANVRAGPFLMVANVVQVAQGNPDRE